MLCFFIILNGAEKRKIFQNNYSADNFPQIRHLHLVLYQTILNFFDNRSEVWLDINALYKDAIAGKKEAEDKLFSHLSERFEQFLHRRIWNKDDAQEILQETLMSIAKEYKTIGIERSFLAWAYKLLDYKILSYIKGRKQRGNRIISVADTSIAVDSMPDIDPKVRAILLDCLRKIGKLNRRYARIIDLHYLGYNTGEICLRLELSRNGFYIVLHRARKMLEICLETGEVK
jgi:RNA polymerase sigma factor (sigma-70 family)